MKAAQCVSFHDRSPLDGLRLAEMDEPDVPAGWVRVDLAAAALNGHDLWSLRGVGLSGADLPRTLGSDGAGIVRGTGERVVVYPVVSPAPPGTAADLDAQRSPLLSERHDGTLATSVVVPAHCAVPIPAGLSFEHAAALPTAWLTAYRMLYTLGRCVPGETILIQGATGGLSTALTMMASRTGLRVWVTARTEQGRAWALEHGAHQAFATGDRLPDRVDAVMESVGEATWAHSLRALHVGGRLVVAGATSGAAPSADLQRVFFRQLQVIGARMGTMQEFRALLDLVQREDLRPPVASVTPLDRVHLALDQLDHGGLNGKLVIDTSS